MNHVTTTNALTETAKASRPPHLLNRGRIYSLLKASHEAWAKWDALDRQVAALLPEQENHEWEEGGNFDGPLTFYPELSAACHAAEKEWLAIEGALEVELERESGYFVTPVDPNAPDPLPPAPLPQFRLLQSEGVKMEFIYARKGVTEERYEEERAALLKAKMERTNASANH